MELQKNNEFVAYIPNLDCLWVFYIAGKAEKVSETYEEILVIMKKLLDLLHEFYIPTKIEYSLLTFPEDVESGKTFDFRPSGGTSRTIQSTEGISFQKLMEDIQSIDFSPDEIKNIRIIDIISGITRVSLNGNEKYIDKNSRELYKLWHYDEIVEEQPTIDLFDINIRHCRPEKGINTVYSIAFWTHTDIWFEENEIGLKNRTRLRYVFKKLYENFDVIDTHFDSNKFGEQKTKDVAFGID